MEKINSDTKKKNYQRLNNGLRRMDRAKRKWMEERCKIVERLGRYGKFEEFYETVKHLAIKETRKILKKGIIDKEK